MLGGGFVFGILCSICTIPRLFLFLINANARSRPPFWRIYEQIATINTLWLKSLFISAMHVRVNAYCKPLFINKFQNVGSSEQVVGNAFGASERNIIQFGFFLLIHVAGFSRGAELSCQKAFFFLRFFLL